MVLVVGETRLRAKYDDIRAAARDAGGACSVLILVAPEADAMCAARMIMVRRAPARSRSRSLACE